MAERSIITPARGISEAPTKEFTVLLSRDTVSREQLVLHYEPLRTRATVHDHASTHACISHPVTSKKSPLFAIRKKYKHVFHP